MPSSGTLTVTGTIGPGNTLTAAVFSDVIEFGFDIPNSLLKFRIGTHWNEIDISAATTITVTLSGAAGNYTITVS